jgi:lipopolysaccharide/colanic/teichoic acid biosynthesis glycosyltransferase
MTAQMTDMDAERRRADAPEAQPMREPKVWGLSTVQLHDRFWAARGVQVVRLGEPSEIVEGAELFMLTDPRTLVMMRIREVVEKAIWMQPDLLIVRLKNMREEQYSETALCDSQGMFIRYQRNYGGWDSRLARICFTRDPVIVRSWQNATDVRTIWQKFRKTIQPEERVTMTLTGRVYDRTSSGETAQFVRDLVQQWKRPDTTIPGIEQHSTGVWVMKEGAGRNVSPKIDSGTEFIGPVWIGAGRQVGAGHGHAGIVGPTALWDDSSAQPAQEKLEWQEIEPADVLTRTPHIEPTSGFYEISKRLFDIAGALFGILLTLPIYPIVFIATFVEDGLPIFYAQKRETRGGREFGCLKFRSMRRNADAIKAKLQAENQADGPQFFMQHDPRLTNVGRILRKYNIDELPQLWNVLLGDMSLVGPRPSPRAENQFCPPWREARLSVRPGLTGLWQVKRTRRRGLDFQEWIKFDLEYVKRAGWRQDVLILFETVRVLILGPRS